MLDTELNDDQGSLATFVYQRLNLLQVNIHLSCCRMPLADDVQLIWNDNKESLTRFVELSYSRIYGKVKDATGRTITDATIKFSGTSFSSNVSRNGFYQKYLIPKTYTVIAEHQPSEIVQYNVVITGTSPLRRDFILVDKPKYYHHRFVDLIKQLKNLTRLCPSIASLSSIGKSVQGKELYLLEISSNPGSENSGRPEFAYIAGG